MNQMLLKLATFFEISVKVRWIKQFWNIASSGNKMFLVQIKLIDYFFEKFGKVDNW